MRLIEKFKEYCRWDSQLECDLRTFFCALLVAFTLFFAMVALGYCVERKAPSELSNEKPKVQMKGVSE